MNFAKAPPIDLPQHRSPEPIEIKSDMTPYSDFFKYPATIGESLNVPVEQRMVVYHGTETFFTKNDRYVTTEDYSRSK